MEHITNTNIDIDKLKQEIANLKIKLQEYELIVQVNPDVKQLLTSTYQQADYQAMTTLNDYFKYKVKKLFSDNYYPTDFNNMYNLYQWLTNTFCLINNVKGYVKIYFTSEYTSTDFDSMTNFVNWLDSIYLKISNLKTQVETFLTSTFLDSDYLSFTGFNQYLTGFYVKLPIQIQFGDSNYSYGYDTTYQTNSVFITNSIRVAYVALAPNKAYDNHFNHLFIWKNLDNNITSGQFSQYLNFLPTSVDANAKPLVYMYGNINQSVTGTAQLRIRIGKKKITINFAAGLWTNQCSVVHLSFKDYQRINFDDLIGRNVSSNATYNPFLFDVSEFLGGNPGNYNIWSSTDGYYQYHYDDEVDNLVINAGRYTNGNW